MEPKKGAAKYGRSLPQLRTAKHRVPRSPLAAEKKLLLPGRNEGRVRECRRHLIVMATGGAGHAIATFSVNPRCRGICGRDMVNGLFGARRVGPR